MKSVVFAAASGRPVDLVDDRANAGRFRASRLSENLCVDPFSECDLISVWLVGHPVLAQTLERTAYAALYSRIQVRVQLKPVVERERFAQLIAHALKSAGCQQTLFADSGLEILRQASKGLPRQAGRILCTAMRLAVPKGLNHLPDELLQQAIAELQ
jgi:type II secretory pathway predicted ATPase ExeA